MTTLVTTHQFELSLARKASKGVSIHWTGILDWTGLFSFWNLCVYFLFLEREAYIFYNLATVDDYSYVLLPFAYSSLSYNDLMCVM